MPKRLVRDWTDSTRMDGISAEGERLFMRLIMKADDYGRFHGEPRMVRGICFPLLDNLRTEHVGRWLDELSHHNLIFRYEVEGRSILAIAKFGQRLNQSRAKFPQPVGKPENWLMEDVGFPDPPGSPGNPPEVPGSPGNPPPDKKRRDKEEKRSAQGAETPSLGKACGTKEELRAYAVEIGMPAADGEVCHHKWEANGWTINGKKLKDWRAAMQAWKGQGYLASQNGAVPKERKPYAPPRDTYVAPAPLTPEQQDAKRRDFRAAKEVAGL